MEKCKNEMDIDKNPSKKNVSIAQQICDKEKNFFFY